VCLYGDRTLCAVMAERGIVDLRCDWWPTASDVLALWVNTKLFWRCCGVVLVFCVCCCPKCPVFSEEVVVGKAGWLDDDSPLWVRNSAFTPPLGAFPARAAAAAAAAHTCHSP
jgi:hypothetical protein